MIRVNGKDGHFRGEVEYLDDGFYKIREDVIELRSKKGEDKIYERKGTVGSIIKEVDVGYAVSDTVKDLKKGRGRLVKQGRLSSESMVVYLIKGHGVLVEAEYPEEYGVSGFFRVLEDTIGYFKNKEGFDELVKEGVKVEVLKSGNR